MAQKNIADLTSEANVIRDETNAGANTKLRVRNMLINIIDSFINNDKISTDGTFAAADNTHVPTTQAVKTYVDANVQPSLFLGLYTSLVNLEAAHPTATSGNWAIVDPGSGTDAIKYLWDEDEGWVSGGSGAGVLSVTGDGVDNTDPANPVISWPDPGDIGAANATHTHAISDVTNLQTALDAKANALIKTRTVTGAHTLDATDLADIQSGKQLTIRGDNTGDLTIPLDATQAFPLGTVLMLRGFENILAAGGVSVDSSAGNFESPGVGF
jgi:hypothetical protein